MCRNLCHFIWGIWRFHRSKDFEAMMSGKSAIWPWLGCQYNKNTLMDLPSSVDQSLNSNFNYLIWKNSQEQPFSLWLLLSPFKIPCFHAIQSCANLGSDHGRRKVHDYFLLLLGKSSILFTKKHFFKIIIFFFNTLKCAANYII